jgi:putative transposase
LAKQIVSVGWGQFLDFVKYKLERKGGLFIKVDRFYASSKLCNNCGYKKEDLTLKDRHWVCPNCGTDHDRDENAKFNLIDEGVRILETEYGIKIVA